VTLADAICLLNYMYLGGPIPWPLKVADMNGDCTINFADVIYLIRFLFRGGPAPLAGCVP
jgi:hypothetical protein